MSAILSADALNDFINPGVACIKPIETFPQTTLSNPYEVTTEDQVAATEAKLQAAQISLTDCLACSGCVTSAEAVLVSLQSHTEVLSVLDSATTTTENSSIDPAGQASRVSKNPKRVFIASVSPQTRASLAAATGKSSQQVGHMIDWLLLQAIAVNGKRGFDYVIDTSALLSVCLHLASREVQRLLAEAKFSSDGAYKSPILTSECPGFVCYLEKTHPEILPHLSKLKSPQALLGTLLKSLLPKYLEGSPEIYHVAIMPCFDKKLEASRAELTNSVWNQDSGSPLARDVDCVITTRELLQLAEARGVEFSLLSPEPVPMKRQIPIPALQQLLISMSEGSGVQRISGSRGGTSGGYLASIMQRIHAEYPGSTIVERQGRNTDVAEVILLASDGKSEIARMARYYGFRNIQNLVRRLRPAKHRMLPGAVSRASSRTPRSPAANSGGSVRENGYCYVEVMACPGGCTNGGGQIKANEPYITDRGSIHESNAARIKGLDSKVWLAKVDEAYYSEEDEEMAVARRTAEKDHIPPSGQHPADAFLEAWTTETGISLTKLAYTTYQAVESDVGRPTGEITVAQAAELAQKVGGGW